MCLPQTRSPVVEMEAAEGPRRTGAWSSAKGKKEWRTLFNAIWHATKSSKVKAHLRECFGFPERTLTFTETVDYRSKTIKYAERGFKNGDCVFLNEKTVEKRKHVQLSGIIRDLDITWQHLTNPCQTFGCFQTWKINEKKKPKKKPVNQSHQLFLWWTNNLVHCVYKIYSPAWWSI